MLKINILRCYYGYVPFIYSILLVLLGDFFQVLGYNHDYNTAPNSGPSGPRLSPPSGPIQHFFHYLKRNVSVPLYILFIITGAGALVICIILYHWLVNFYKWLRGTSMTPAQLQPIDREMTQIDPEEAKFLLSLSTIPPRFSSEEIIIATNNFCKVIGEGGFGKVYEGMLSNGNKVAIKKLERPIQGQNEFRTELTIVGSIHHNRLIKLCGFCLEASNQILVYEFMSHGSLDRWIFGDAFLDWSTRLQIAFDVATGLCYLHRDCGHKIIHFDIKPENILLDDNFRAKVADFGLSKLCNNEESYINTNMRGTPGYIALEWYNHRQITEKCVVYSYRMVLLELISGRRNRSNSKDDSKNGYFPSWIVRKLTNDKQCQDIVESQLRSMLTDANWEQVYQVIKVSFWCIPDDPKSRLSMEKIVHMLEGVVKVDDSPLVFDFLKYS